MRHADNDVLRDVTFQARRGEVLVMLGPNGAGKTTTIEILEGFRKRSAGSVSVLGVDPAEGDERWRARIGVVLQSWRDRAKWRVRDLVTHLAALYLPYATESGRRPWDTDELLALVGLTEQSRSKIATLSGGQRRRLDVAIGILGRPDVLFMDEPTAGFDPAARRDFHDLVHRLSDLEDTTVLLTTHDLDEAEKLADRILILAGGHIVADAPRTRWPARLRARPRCAGASAISGSCTPPRSPPSSSTNCSSSTAMPSATSRSAARHSKTPTWRSSAATSPATVVPKLSPLRSHPMNPTANAVRAGMSRGWIELRQLFTTAPDLIGQS